MNRKGSEVMGPTTKRWLGIGLTAVVLLLIWITGGYANQGADQMELFGGTRGKVPFPHHLHQNTLKDCNACHAIFPQEAGSIAKLKAAGKLKKKQVMNGQCVKCHKARKKASESYGPVTCSKCHVKKK